MPAHVTPRRELVELLADMRAPTDDDVPIDREGNRLDTPDKVRAHLDRINRERGEHPA
ncbi:MAG: hypothetical protein U0Q07_17250 [Acidimicrobiales bacterium]